jgi:hypothetical protein
MLELERSSAEAVQYAPHVTPRRRPSGEIPTDSSATSQRGAKRRRGRPPVHQESWTKVTVVLFDRQVEFLDRLTANLRTHHGAMVSRAQLIRALVDTVEESVEEKGAAIAGVDSAILSKLGVANSER